MHYKVIAPIFGLQWSNDLEGSKLDVFTFTKNVSLINTYINNYQFAVAIGNLYHGNFAQLPCIVFDDINAKLEIYTYSQKIHSIINSVLSHFWLLEDCNLFTQKAFVQNAVTGEIVVDSRSMISNASGSSCDTNFNENDVEKLNLLINNTVKPFLDKQTTSNFNNNENLYHTSVLNISTTNFLNPQNDNRTERANEFLYFARSNTKLTVKISFYVAIYECLLSTDTTEIAHKIAERAAKMLGTDKSERILIYDQLKEAYDVRSKYIHGSKEKRSDNELIKISKGMDTLTRTLFNNPIFKEEKIFSYSSEELEKWFKELILN